MKTLTKLAFVILLINFSPACNMAVQSSKPNKMIHVSYLELKRSASAERPVNIRWMKADSRVVHEDRNRSQSLVVEKDEAVIEPQTKSSPEGFAPFILDYDCWTLPEGTLRTGGIYVGIDNSRSVVAIKFE